MALDSDYMVDRRRLKRRLALWRTLAILAFVGVVFAAVGRLGGLPGAGLGGDFIARLHVDGIIVNDARRLKAIETLADNDNVKAVIVRIDSPGGTVVGGETLYRAFRELAQRKPVVAVMDGLATSAAYMTAIAADRIIAREGTLTGSVGVILQATEITGLLESIGVTATEFKSGHLKAQPSPFERISPEVERATQTLIDEMYAMFRDMVLERRNMTQADAAVFADGRVFTGRQALRNRLIDEIGGESEALAWLQTEKGLSHGLEIRTVRIRRDVDDLIGRLDSLARKTILSERLTLDGLISVWQPQTR